MTPLRAFGEGLREARERRGISLAAIAGTTKITRSLLEGLERGDCSRWPGGIYNRAYLRDYAKAVGLNPDEVVARFVACFVDPTNPPAAPGVHPPAGTAAGPSSLRLTLASDAGERATAVLLRSRLLAIDAMMVAGAAAALTSTAGTDFWMSAAAVSLGFQAIGVLRSGGSTGATLAAWLRRAGTPARSDERQVARAAAESTSVQLSWDEGGLHERVT